jgi:competence protein ComEA
MLRTVLTIVALASLAAVQPQLAAAQSSKGGRSTAKPAVTGTININTASVAELQTLPGIGSKTAERIVEYRQKNGPFKKVEELMNVRGVGEKNFLKLKGHLSVATSKADHDHQPQR